MSMIKVKTGLIIPVFCLMALSFTASAVLDPDIISSVSRVSGADAAAAVVVKGGLTTGALPYMDRAVTQAVFSDVGYFGGMDYIQTAGADKNDADVQYQVTLNKAGTLYLFIDNRVGDNVSTNEPNLTSTMTWVTTMGFTSTHVAIDLGIGATPATIYALPVAAAGTITLLQNDTSSTSRTMYGIAAAPTTWNLTNKAPIITGVASAVATKVNTVTVDSTITDDGIPSTPGLSIAWTTVSQPAGSTATFAPSATAEDVTITLSQLGVYTFRVTASDDEKAISKTMVVTYAETFALQATDHCMACNDSNTGPAGTRRTTISDPKNYNDGTAQRRRVAYYKYDITSAKTPGKVFANSYLSMNVDKWTAGSTNHLYVYALKEDLDSLTLTGKTWNTIPGVINTPSAPALNSPITIDTLDKPDLTPLLLSYSPTTLDVWLSTPASPALDDLLNTDTDGNIVLMFICYDPESNGYEICSSTHGSVIEPVTGMKGIILRGNITKQIWANTPTPANNSTTTAGLTQLSWINPDPNQPGGTITCDVYFHECVDNEPNTLDDPNYMEADYGYTTLATGIAGNSVTLPAGTISGFKKYNWIVDIHDTTRDETTRGYLWTFDTNNAAPEVSVRIVDDVVPYVWLNNTPGDPNAVVDLDGTVIDDGLPSPPNLTMQWTQIGTTPAIVNINPSTVEDITVELPTSGTYQFRLTADDGNATNSADIQIVVAETQCAAAQAMPEYIPIVGDIDDDCDVDLDDLRLFVANWLDCNYLPLPCN